MKKYISLYVIILFILTGCQFNSQLKEDTSSPATTLNHISTEPKSFTTSSSKDKFEFQETVQSFEISIGPHTSELSDAKTISAMSEILTTATKLSSSINVSSHNSTIRINYTNGSTERLLVYLKADSAQAMFISMSDSSTAYVLSFKNTETLRKLLNEIETDV